MSWGLILIMKPEPINKNLVNQMLLCFGLMFASQVGECDEVFAFIYEFLIVNKPWIPRIVVECCHFLELLSSVWKLEKSRHGIQPVSPIYVWGYFQDSRCILFYQLKSTCFAVWPWPTGHGSDITLNFTLFSWFGVWPWPTIYGSDINY